MSNTESSVTIIDLDLVTNGPAREELSRRITRSLDDLKCIHLDLQSRTYTSGSDQLYVETQFARAIEIIGSCVQRLRH